LKKKILHSGIAIFALLFVGLTHYLAYSRGAYLTGNDIKDRQLPELLPQLCQERWKKIENYSQVTKSEFLKMTEFCANMIVSPGNPAEIFGEIWVCPKRLVRGQPTPSRMDGSAAEYVKADRLVQRALLQAMSEQMITDKSMGVVQRPPPTRPPK
jgi:hypothetical protein